MSAHNFYIETADRYRTVAEERIVEFLLSPYEIAAGARESDFPVARTILARCVALGLPHRLSSDGRRLFDPVEVQNFIKYAYLKWGEPIWPDRNVPIFRRLMSHSVGSAPVCCPPALSELKSTRCVIRIVRQFNLAKHRVGDIVRLRLPLPVADPTIRGFSTSFLPFNTRRVHAICEEGRLDVRLVAPECKSAEIGVDIQLYFTDELEKSTASLDSSEMALYTKRSEGLIKLNKRVIELSKRIVGSTSARSDIIHAIWDFMFDELDLGAIYYDRIDPQNPLDWTLDNRLYDCRVGSALIVALCRAQAIPARLVAGYTLNPVLPTMHTWIEVWFDDKGWLPFDLYSIVLCGGDRDSPWRHYFFGQIDRRLITERFPRLFSGLGSSVRLPVAWQLISATHDDGMLLSFEDLSTGDLTYSEKIAVTITG